jgi:hypothetical protein
MVRTELHRPPMPNSYIKFLADEITGLDFDRALVDTITGVAFGAALIASWLSISATTGLPVPKTRPACRASFGGNQSFWALGSLISNVVPDPTCVVKLIRPLFFSANSRESMSPNPSRPPIPFHAAMCRRKKKDAPQFPEHPRSLIDHLNNHRPDVGSLPCESVHVNSGSPMRKLDCIHHKVSDNEAQHVRIRVHADGILHCAAHFDRFVKSVRTQQGISSSRIQLSGSS